MVSQAGSSFTLECHFFKSFSPLGKHPQYVLIERERSARLLTGTTLFTLPFFSHRVAHVISFTLDSHYLKVRSGTLPSTHLNLGCISTSSRCSFSAWPLAMPQLWLLTDARTCLTLRLLYLANIKGLSLSLQFALCLLPLILTHILKNALVLPIND